MTATKEKSGGYIDRDVFIKSQRELYCKNCPKREGIRNGKKQELYPIGGVVCRACELNDALDALEDYPTADVAPVVRGKWLFSLWHGRRICSICKWETDEIGYYSPYQFCPRCGAKMEAGE